ncbi:MAG: hypothetical protein ABEK42_03575, partial [Thiohalorhabdaceae bacterium]
NGNPVANAEVTLSNWPLRYATGFRSGPQDVDIGPGGNTSSEGTPIPTAVFPNEDTDEDLNRDPGEDIDGNGYLTPKNSAAGSIPDTVTTDDAGLATFDLTYLKQFASWSQVRIR